MTGHFLSFGGQGGTEGARGGGGVGGTRRILIVTLKFADPPYMIPHSKFSRLPPYWKLIGSQVSIVLNSYSVGED